jgi:hypothetical protein
MLLAPVANQLGNKRLLIVGDGILQSIPFAALPIPDKTSPSTPLLQGEGSNSPPFPRREGGQGGVRFLPPSWYKTKSSHCLQPQRSPYYEMKSKTANPPPKHSQYSPIPSSPATTNASIHPNPSRPTPQQIPLIQPDKL